MGLDNGIHQVADPYIVCNEEHRFLAQEQLREVGMNISGFLLEPVGRNTGPALTLAALAAIESGEDPVLVITPSDQTIANEPAFQAAMEQAIEAATQGNIVILGITPTKPETGYLTEFLANEAVKSYVARHEPEILSISMEEAVQLAEAAQPT